MGSEMCIRDRLGFEIISTGGTADVLRRNGVSSVIVSKIRETSEGDQSIVDLINAGDIDLILNSPSGGQARGDGFEIRAAAISMGVPVVTTVSQFGAAVQGIQAMRDHSWDVMSIQEHEMSLEQAQADRANV